jgi:chloride intracellular channel protein 2
VAGLIENVYSKFKLMLLKRDEPSKNSLVAQLTRINDHLESTGNRFLTGKLI